MRLRRGLVVSAAALLAAAVAPAALAQSSPSPGAPSKAQAAFADGQALAAAKHPTEAAEKFEVAVAAEPGFAPGWYALAAARRRAGQCDRAIPAYRRYAELLPREPEPYYGLGVCLRDTGDRAGARDALNRYLALEKRPTAQRWIEHARLILTDLAEPSRPAAGTERAVPSQAKTPAAGEAARPKPPQPPAEVAIARPRGSKTTPGLKPGGGETAAAPQTSAPAADVHAAGSGGAAAAYGQAQSLRDRGRIDEAIAKFREAIATDPAHMNARAALGELLLKIERDDEAIAVFRAAVEQNPGYALAWYELAFALRVRGRPSEAVDAYQRYIKLRPADPDPYFGLARALQKLGRSQDAVHAYRTYVSMEKRPSEQKWVHAAQAQIAALGQAGGGAPAP